MTFWDWLASPQGVEFDHAILVFLNIIGVWLAHRANKHVSIVEKRLDRHTATLMRQIHGGHRHPGQRDVAK